MDTSPVTNWEEAEAIFTWADSPGMLTFWLLVMLAIVVGVIVQSMLHEKKSFERADRF